MCSERLCANRHASPTCQSNPRKGKQGRAQNGTIVPISRSASKDSDPTKGFPLPSFPVPRTPADRIFLQPVRMFYFLFSPSYTRPLASIRRALIRGRLVRSQNVIIRLIEHRVPCILCINPCFVTSIYGRA